MLNRISDFYRIVNPEPPDALITQRREAIVSFLKTLSTPELRYACADIAAFGLTASPTSPQADAAKSIVAAIQVPQPSFSSDFASNAVDVRVFAGIALGEYLNAHSDDATAALIISALGTRELPQERYLSQFVSTLFNVAQRSIEAEGHAKRERPELQIADIQGADWPNIQKSLKNSLKGFREAIDRSIRVDREELQILWWVFGGYSTTLSKPFHDLHLPERALASASELAELVIVPPVVGSAHFLHAILKEDGKLTLNQLIEPCAAPVLESLSRRRSEVNTVLTGHPALLPLTWLCFRRLDSGMAGGWEIEFEQKTHISAKDQRTASSWAAQIFNECVAGRIVAASGAQDEA